MKIQTQFSVFLVNRPGVLASVTAALGEAKVNIVALALMDSGEHGALRMVCDNDDNARKVLGEIHDRWTESPVLVVDMENQPGSFATMARKLSDAEVNITYAYFSGATSGGATKAVFKVPDLEKGQKVLGG
jgi:hypothetical protein